MQFMHEARADRANQRINNSRAQKKITKNRAQQQAKEKTIKCLRPLLYLAGNGDNLQNIGGYND